MPIPQNETNTIAGVDLSNPDRVLFPQQGLTKRDLANYLNKMSAQFLTHTSKRLLSLVRCPQGREDKCFFQRHRGAGLQNIFQTLAIDQKGGKKQDYIYITSKKEMIQAAQMGVLEFHIWGSHIDDIERPDRLVFDLDPADDVNFATVKEAAFHMRDVLDALGLKSYPLLTGGKGIHVVAPIVRRHTWPLIKDFTATIAKRMAEDKPDTYIAVSSLAKRKGRIFIDYLRNERGSTAIAPFSPRAREGAPVAWPVDWEDLHDIEHASQFTLADANPKHATAWADYDTIRQSIKKSSLTALGLAADV